MATDKEWEELTQLVIDKKALGLCKLLNNKIGALLRYVEVGRLMKVEGVNDVVIRWRCEAIFVDGHYGVVSAHVEVEKFEDIDDAIVVALIKERDKRREQASQSTS